MREIKFRAWDKELKVMVYDNETAWHIEYDTNAVRVINIILNEDDYGLEFMQFTGFIDEDGKEIYEGDIVEFKDYGWNDGKYNCIGEVIFEDGAWHITNAISTSELFNYNGEGIRVVGNIYENPELLEV